jgi:hypothetical protein
VLLPALQRAVLSSQRYPSTALAFVADPRDRAQLRQRVAALRMHVLATLRDHARRAGLPRPTVHARIAFGLVAELTSQTYCEPDIAPEHPDLARALLQLALAGFGATSGRP